ncbi:MAG: sugar ABC transporter permease [Anaerolineae bacterium]|nr:sugar ABC transporter permease [Anaerolineae bacterium]
MAFGNPALAARQAVHNRGVRWQRDITAYLFLAPYLILFTVFLLIPAVVGVYTSFTNWNIAGTPQFIGMKNYQTIFADRMFQQALVNTLYYVAITAIPLIVFGLLLALLLNQKLRGRSIVRTIIFLPYVVSVSAVGIVWVWLYHRNFGLINFYIQPLGINPPIDWLANVDTAMPAIALTTLWWTVNTNMIIYLAGLQDIPEELYEAARIDGAGSTQLFRHITIPMLMPVNAFIIPTTVIACWRVFGQTFVMTQGGPQGRTFVLAQYIYLTAFQNFRMGQAAAAAVILLVLTLIFTVIQLRAMRVL